MAVDGFDDSVEFVLRNLQKETLELTVHQKQAIKSILIGKDTLVCLPTGHGKSIIFECLPHCYDYLHGASSPQGQPSSVIVISTTVNNEVTNMRHCAVSMHVLLCRCCG